MIRREGGSCLAAMLALMLLAGLTHYTNAGKFPQFCHFLFCLFAVPLTSCG